MVVLSAKHPTTAGWRVERANVSGDLQSKQKGDSSGGLGISDPLSSREGHFLTVLVDPDVLAVTLSPKLRATRVNK